MQHAHHIQEHLFQKTQTNQANQSQACSISSKIKNHFLAPLNYPPEQHATKGVKLQ